MDISGRESHILLERSLLPSTRRQAILIREGRIRLRPEVRRGFESGMGLVGSRRQFVFPIGAEPEVNRKQGGSLL